MAKVNKKVWYLSKTVWSAVAVALVAILQVAGVPIPNEVYAILGALGIYGLRTAQKTL